MITSVFFFFAGGTVRTGGSSLGSNPARRAGLHSSAVSAVRHSPTRSGPLDKLCQENLASMWDILNERHRENTQHYNNIMWYLRPCHNSLKIEVPFIHMLLYVTGIREYIIIESMAFGMWIYIAAHLSMIEYLFGNIHDFDQSGSAGISWCNCTTFNLKIIVPIFQQCSWLQFSSEECSSIMIGVLFQ